MKKMDVSLVVRDNEIGKRMFEQLHASPDLMQPDFYEKYKSDVMRLGKEFYLEYPDQSTRVFDYWHHGWYSQPDIEQLD